MKRKFKYTQKILKITFILLTFIWALLISNPIVINNHSLNLLNKHPIAMAATPSQNNPSNSRKYLNSHRLRNKEVLMITGKRGYEPGERVIIKVEIATKNASGWGENTFSTAIYNPSNEIIWQESTSLSTLQSGPQKMVKFILPYPLTEDSPLGKYQIMGILKKKNGKIVYQETIYFRVGIPTIEKCWLSERKIEPGEDTYLTIVLSNPNPTDDLTLDWQMNIIDPAGDNFIQILSEGKETISPSGTKKINVPLQVTDIVSGYYLASLILRDFVTKEEYDRQEVPVYIGKQFLTTFEPNKKTFRLGDKVAITVNLKKDYGGSVESLKSINITGEIYDSKDALISRISKFTLNKAANDKSVEEPKWQSKYIVPSNILPGKYYFHGEINENGSVVGYCHKIFEIQSDIEIDFKRIKIKACKRNSESDPARISIDNLFLLNRAKNPQKVTIKAFLENLQGLPLGEKTIELTLNAKNRKFIEGIDLTLMGNNEKHCQLILSILNDEGMVLAQEEKTVHLEKLGF